MKQRAITANELADVVTTWDTDDECSDEEGYSHTSFYELPLYETSELRKIFRSNSFNKEPTNFVIYQTTEVLY